MDSINFVSSIQISDFTSAITQFFDEFMALHNLIGSYSSVQNIEGEVKNGTSIAFRLNFKSKQDAISANFLLSGIGMVAIYDRNFTVKNILDDNSIMIEFISE